MVRLTNQLRLGIHNLGCGFSKLLQDSSHMLLAVNSCGSTLSDYSLSAVVGAVSHSGTTAKNSSVSISSDVGDSCSRSPDRV